jgi:acyl carrier protein
MEKKEISEKVIAILLNAMDNQKLVLTNESDLSEFDEWDSLARMSFIAKSQEEFGVKYSPAEMLGWTTVESLVECISKKL